MTHVVTKRKTRRLVFKGKKVTPHTVAAWRSLSIPVFNLACPWRSRKVKKRTLSTVLIRWVNLLHAVGLVR
eukprot:2503918-Amphidinium_carterae.2